ncbi:MAG: hypothetical protein CO186_10230 [Zetaproteobacteria bacterium CG_4_9_14_3_um_filter_49_83]|nr:MAG: hypothetical protein AUJ56_07365 [Zetaproteobacteria bacterium CG1_02_49_23]PIQ34489.1 MAG: hypothetical protein COW62_01395 [Zetaproteobacteria bacterium CG17_big_fil_post_rev_8_21_14_2_50_50_13]PIV29250.1 MAG: hypothetical protein COS35_12980 [Zetaproteobacteria bacterium CG02_land_8_20_14_3_00_50_9]PIY56084.1 MAG: hypothetical protein COZ00_05990 [Zetaproteobacteria bacterium CG_4_10_14_0_8_um_filter_49_80]PJA34524.1 MAG: hypothetical protein CO186_10230 [Zetaproteobacteria bacterium
MISNAFVRCNRWVAVGLCFALPIALGACSYAANEQPAADQLVQRLHQNVKTQDFEAMTELYDESFFKAQDRQAWQKKWQGFAQQFGTLEEIRPIFSQRDARYRGDYYIYGFKLVFARGSLHETISVFKGIEGGSLSIMGHVVEPG